MNFLAKIFMATKGAHWTFNRKTSFKNLKKRKSKLDLNIDNNNYFAAWKLLFYSLKALRKIQAANYYMYFESELLKLL